MSFLILYAKYEAAFLTIIDGSGMYVISRIALSLSLTSSDVADCNALLTICPAMLTMTVGSYFNPSLVMYRPA